MNWTPSTIFEGHDKALTDRAGHTYYLHLRDHGWAITWTEQPRMMLQDLSVLEACYWLNSREATIVAAVGAQ